MENVESKLIAGFASVELEERLEMVNLSVFGELKVDSTACDVEGGGEAASAPVA